MDLPTGATMMRLTISCVLAVSLLSNIASGQSSDSLEVPPQQILEMAHRVASVQQDYNNLLLIHEFLSMVGTRKAEANLASYHFRVRESAMTCRFSNEYNRLRNVVQVVHCSFSDAIPSNEYLMAFGRTGNLYFLRGFEKNDFDKMVRHAFGEVVEAHEARQLAELYIATVELDLTYDRVFIDSTNVEMYRGQFPGIQRPSVARDEEGFDVRLYTLDLPVGRVILHCFQVRRDGKSSYSRVENEYESDYEYK